MGAPLPPESIKQIHDELDEAVLEAYGWQDLAGTALRSGSANEMRMNDPRSPTQSHLPGTETESSQSKINNHQSSIINPSSPWPDRLPAQVTLIRQLLTTDPTATPEQPSNNFGRKNQKRTEQIEGIIETLKGLGQV